MRYRRDRYESIACLARLGRSHLRDVVGFAHRFSAKGHLPPELRLIVRCLAARPSLRAGRTFSSARKMACLIDHNAAHIKWLDARTGTPAAGSRRMLLREAAGGICVGISHRFPINLSL